MENPAEPDEDDGAAPAPKNKGGRKPNRLPPAIVEKIGSPPDDPLARAEWASNAMAQVVSLQITGQIGSDYACELRNSLRALSSMVPTHTVARVRDKLRDRDRTVDRDAAGGPPIEDTPRAGQPVRE